MKKKRISKMKRVMQGQTIEKVVHGPKRVTFHLANGSKVTISSYVHGWEGEDNGLDFKYENLPEGDSQ